MSLIQPTGRRSRPYSDSGILRMACWRCGRRAAFQWRHRSCAEAAARYDREHYRPLCVPCDIECNRTVLAFYDEPDIEAIIGAYNDQAWSAVHEDTAGRYCDEFPDECPTCRQAAP